MNPISPHVQRMIAMMSFIARMSLLGDDALLTIEQVAIILGVSSRTVADQSRIQHLPKPIRLGNLVRWRLCDMRDRIRRKYVLLDEQILTRETQVPPIPDKEMSFTYEHMAIALSCSVRMVAKLKAAGRLPPPFKHHPMLWRPSEIHRWVMFRCR